MAMATKAGGKPELTGSCAPGAAQTMSDTLRAHWPEYLVEATLLGLFLVSAGVLGTLLEYPGSPLRRAIAEPLSRRALMGAGMGLTAIAIIYSPWGRRSGAHLNPAVTLTFWRLGKVDRWDALFYVVAQFSGGLLGVALVVRLLGAAFTEPPVHYVATTPGGQGVAAAVAAELVISCLLMTTVLVVSNSRYARFTGLCAGALVAASITFEAPLSGMSMNPARSVASALPAGSWNTLWVYLVAPPTGMLLAAALYARVKGRAAVRCAKLDHGGTARCIFRCGFRLVAPPPAGERGGEDARPAL
jgi:aquaporin Z